MSRKDQMAAQILLKERRVDYWSMHGQIPSYEELDEEAFSFLENPRDRNLFA